MDGHDPSSAIRQRSGQHVSHHQAAPDPPGSQQPHPLIVQIPHGEVLQALPQRIAESLPRGCDDRLHKILDRLELTIKENTRYLKSRNSSDKVKDGSDDAGIDDEKALRDSIVDVDVRVTFLRIIDVDTVNQSYTAEIFLQAKWMEPRLAELNEQLYKALETSPNGELDDVKWERFWDPKMVITNIDGEPDEDQIWRRAKMDAATKRPLMIYRRRVRCKLKENLELANFPVDVQELTVQVSSDRASEEVNLREDMREISAVTKGGFADEHEWELYDFVEVHKRDAEVKDVMNARYKHPKLDCQCYVGRRPGYFFWNVILIMLLISLLTFTSFSISPDKPQSRLGVTLTLLLTAVAFKFVVNQSLPRISYLTYLDIYVLSGMIFLGLQAVQNSVVSLYASSVDDGSSAQNGTSTTTNLEQAKNLDFYYMVAMGVILVIFNVVFFILLAVKGIGSRREMRRFEAQYQLKKKRMSKMLKTHDSVFGRSSKKVAPVEEKSSQRTTSHRLSHHPSPAVGNGHSLGYSNPVTGTGHNHDYSNHVTGTYAQYDPEEETPARRPEKKHKKRRTRFSKDVEAHHERDDYFD